MLWWVRVAPLPRLHRRLDNIARWGRVGQMTVLCERAITYMRMWIQGFSSLLHDRRPWSNEISVTRLIGRRGLFRIPGAAMHGLDSAS